MKIMDLFRRQPAEVQVEVEHRDHQFWQQWSGLFGPNASGGLTVTEQMAYRLAPVRQAIQMISEEIATLPLEVWRVDDKEPTRDRALTHPAYRLLRWEPNHLYTAAQWRRIIMVQTLLYGNGISEIIRDSMNRPIAIWPLEPWRIQMFWFEVTGSLREVQYRYTPVDGGQRIIQPEDVIHIRALDSQIGLWGDSPILACAGAVGLTQAAQDFATAFFSNGSALSGVLSHPGELGETAFQSLKQSWAEAFQGGGFKAYKPALLEEGMTWTPIGTPPEEGQMIQTRDQQVKEIARVFNIPPHRLGASTDSFTYSSEVQERQAFYTSTIRPWAVQFEQEINLKLLSRGFRSDFDFSEALRADQKTRFEAHALAISAGWMEKNEVRVSEGLNEIDGLDDPDVGVPSPVAVDGDSGDEPADGDDPDEVLDALVPILEVAVERLISRQQRDLGEMHEDKRDEYFRRQFEAWTYALHPPLAALRHFGIKIEDTGNLVARFVNMHRDEIERGIDPSTWDSDDIVEEILHG